MAVNGTAEAEAEVSTASKWIVAEDGTAVVEAEISMRLPKTGATRAVRVPLIWFASLETLAVTHARIEKRDGRVTPIGTAAVREDPPMGDRHFHEYSDLRRMIVTFPGADPDDLLVVRTRREGIRPLVPGGFMTAPILARSVGWEESDHTISVPSKLPFHIETRGFDHQSEIILDRTVHYIRSQKPTGAARDVTILGQFDRQPRFAVSTFRDWDDFARSYGGMLTAHATVTPAVRAMAVKLTRGQENTGEQARLLYEWVRDHIQRVPVPLDESRPEPHDAETVLTNRYADNKDLVVLLRALLAARGIAAEPVLLNASDTATIAGPPNLRPMNHLILFLPDLNLYADPSLGISPLGVLPFQDIGKPAIHLGGAGPARRTIPIPAAGESVSETKTVMTLAGDGALTGTTTTTGHGPFSTWVRSVARAIETGNSAAAAVTLLRQRGTPGTGDFSFPSPGTPGREYTMTGTFRLTNQMPLLHGGYFAPWTGLRVVPRPGEFLAGPSAMKGLDMGEPVFCYPGTQRETLTLTLPAGREMGTVPKALAIDTPFVRYRSHWAVEGLQVTVTREFVSTLPGPVCEKAVRARLDEVMRQIHADVTSQIGIQMNTVPPGADDPDDAPKN